MAVRVLIAVLWHGVRWEDVAGTPALSRPALLDVVLFPVLVDGVS